MINLKDTLRRAAGQFIELPPEEVSAPPATANGAEPNLDDLLGVLPGRTPRKSLAQVVQDAPGPNLEEVRVPEGTTAQLTPEGGLDFPAIYRTAGIPEEPFTAEQMVELIAGLPKELPLETKRQTVKISLSSIGAKMGATPETIVADATRKIVALASYNESQETQTVQYVTGAEAQIEELLQQVEGIRTAILEKKGEQAMVKAACEAETDRLDDIPAFFPAPVQVPVETPVIEEAHNPSILDKLKSITNN